MEFSAGDLKIIVECCWKAGFPEKIKKFQKPRPRQPVLCWALFPLEDNVFSTHKQVNTAILPLWQLCLAVLTFSCSMGMVSITARTTYSTSITFR